MDSKGLAKCVFCLVYRLLALAALAWGLYQMAGVPFSIMGLMMSRELYYTFPNAFLTCLPGMVHAGVYLFYGLFALHFFPMILAFLYREE